MSDPEFENVGAPEDRAMEECSELIKAICKAKRFGWLNVHNKRTNIDHVAAECADVLKTVRELLETLSSGKLECPYKLKKDVWELIDEASGMLKLLDRNGKYQTITDWMTKKDKLRER